MNIQFKKGNKPGFKESNPRNYLYLVKYCNPNYSKYTFLIVALYLPHLENWIVSYPYKVLETDFVKEYLPLSEIGINLCKKCGGQAKKSKGYGNAYSIPDAAGARTIYEGEGALIDCWKCSNCGHSWA